ncbi:MAG: fused MFS/spermidine synthase [Nanoarchaeota archaeon]|nr:fused MFS/spermidine synthase [Nanoarchaeota archaeon]
MARNIKEEAVCGKKFLFLTAFIAGFVVMALEIVAFRIFAPYFGFSIYVSGTLISIVMIALSVGYYYGGQLADRKGDQTTLFRWIFYSMIYVFATLISYKYILSFFSTMFMTGIVLSSLLLFGFPMIVLSMVSPYIVKIISRSDGVGQAAGNISAVGTVGAIAGTLIPTFLLIPHIGSFATYAFCALLLLGIVIFFFTSNNKWFLLNLLFIPALFIPTTSIDDNVVLTEESAYNTIKVIHDDTLGYQLRLNDNGNIQSIYDAQNKFNKDFYFYYLNAAPLINDASSVLVLGMGAGTSPQQMIKLYGLSVDAVEIDSDIVAVAQQYFGLDDVQENLHIFVDDARSFLKKTAKKYDLIEIDMYQGGLYVPFYVLTQEFFEETETALNSDGVVVMNVLSHSRAADGDLLFTSVGNTLASVFPTVLYLDLHSANIIFFASNEDLSLSEVQERIRTNAPADMPLFQEMAQALQQYQPLQDVEILTDDNAPIEQLTYKVLAGLSEK